MEYPTSAHHRLVLMARDKLFYGFSLILMCLLLLFLASDSNAIIPDPNLHRRLLRSISQFLFLGVFICSGWAIFETSWLTFSKLRTIHPEQSGIIHAGVAILLLPILALIVHAIVLPTNRFNYPEFITGTLIGYAVTKIIVVFATICAKAVWSRPMFRPAVCFGFLLGTILIILDAIATIENIPNKKQPEVYLVQPKELPSPPCSCDTKTK